MELIYLLIAFFACFLGSICGMGGGVIIKPVLDILGLETVTVARFLSSCTVLGMSCYSVIRNIVLKENKVDMKVSLPLAIGSATGGIAGKVIFSYIKSLFENQDRVGAVQAAVLAVLTLGTVLYTVKKEKIKSLHVENPLLCLLIGLMLGMISSFLGIGGGPINLVVLFFFFSMATKTAATTSLYIILFCQATNLLSTVVSSDVPAFRWPVLVLMVTGGILGGFFGRKLSRKLDHKAVDKLFICEMIIIFLLNVVNIWKFINAA